MYSKNYLPLPEPEFGDQRAFKQRSQNDLNRSRKRPPKLNQKNHELSYSRSLNHSIPQAISFRQSRNSDGVSIIGGHTSSNLGDSSLMNSIFKPNLRESYFDQCFDVLGRIGEGSFGEVYKVRSKEDGQLYAIKKSLQLYRSEAHRQSRIEEVRRYEQFSEHDNCVTLYKAWEQNDLLYMQLELCKSNLESFIFSGDNLLSETQIWNILIDLLLATKALHDQNLIHMDIKSENILIDKDNICKLADFGLMVDSRQASANPSHFTEGDCRYLAPETLYEQFTKAADVFSLGITILEVASKVELPQNGFTWHQLRNGVLPDNYLPHLSKELRKIIKWMMHPDPKSRPDVNTLLALPRIQKMLAYRRLLAPIKIVKKCTRTVIRTLHIWKVFIFFWIGSIFSIFKMKSRKYSPIENNNATISTPSISSATVKSSILEESLSRLNCSAIGLDDSPSNRNSNRSFLKPSDNIMTVSTPLNHHSSSYGNSRRSRFEMSRSSLQFDESFGASSSVNGMSPLKRKKLFGDSDESD